MIFLLQVYKGYVDDPRNTDNSWMETVAVNFHDDLGIINYEECYSFFFLSPLHVSIFPSILKKLMNVYEYKTLDRNTVYKR